MLHQIIQALASTTTACLTEIHSDMLLESIVEGTKAIAILARILPSEYMTLESCQPILTFWTTNYATATSTTNKSNNPVVPVLRLHHHQLSGLYWAYQSLQHVYGNDDDNDQNTLILKFPEPLRFAYQECALPFTILPGFLLGQEEIDTLTVDNLVAQVNFQVDTIRTTSTQQHVKERRETAWEGDEGVPSFEYSGKSMPRNSWSPLVKQIRDQLLLASSVANTGGGGGGGIYYDGCLLNHYPDGGSAMRYHSDPDQGRLWSYETAVISVGASRRVAFRENPNANANTAQQNCDAEERQRQKKQQTKKPHSFVVMHGDAMIMIGNCQERFQHAVKPADNKNEQAARASLVFKKTIQHCQEEATKTL